MSKTMAETYELKVAGLTRQLPLCPLSDELYIAAFVMFSDVELTVACAKALLEKVPDFDVIVTAESKGIPLAYEMSRQCGKKYIPARKMKKLYMKNAQCVEVRSITTDAVQHLYLSGDDMDYMKGKKVLIVDDVISTGESLRALETLVEAAGGNICCKAAVLAEGDAAERKDILFLEKLPIFHA